MNQAKFSYQNDKELYLFKSIYYIRKHLPSNEYFYIVIFILKYFGFIICGGTIKPNENWSKYFSIENMIKNFFLMSGNEISLFSNSYSIISMSLSIVIICFSTLFIILVIYMKIKYSFDSELKKDINEMYNENKFEKKIFMFYSYYYTLTVFLSQFIAEYLLFGLVSHIFYLCGLFSESRMFLWRKGILQKMQYFYSSQGYFPFYTDALTIFIMFVLCVYHWCFLCLVSTKSLYLSYGVAFTGNLKFAVCKFIILNIQPIHSILLLFSATIKEYINLCLCIISILMCIFSFCSCFRQFSFVPNKVSLICIFLEFFTFVSSLTELIIYIITGEDLTIQYSIIKIIVKIINATMIYIYYLRSVNNFNCTTLSKNMFSINYDRITKGEIYFYMQTYLMYKEDKFFNYPKIFRIIQKHMLSCTKNDCPCSKLIDKDICKSDFTDLSQNDNAPTRSALSSHHQKDSTFEPNNPINDNEKTNIELANRFDHEKGERKEKIGYAQNDVSHRYSSKKFRKSSRSLVSGKKNKDSLIESSDFIANENQNGSLIPSQNIYASSKPKKEKGNSKESELSDIIINNNINNQEKSEKIYIMTDEQFQILGEQEIVNRIDFLYKRHRYQVLEDYMFTHIQYIIKIKENLKLALYYVGKYYLNSQKFSFLTRYFLFETKKHIFKLFETKPNQNTNNSRNFIHFKKEYGFLKEIYRFLKFSRLIKNIISDSCRNLITFFNFRRDLHDNLILQSYTNAKILRLFKASDSISKNNKILEKILKRYHDNYQKKLDNIQLCYILTNYFLILYGKMETWLKGLIAPKICFYTLDDKLENEFKNFYLDDPLMVSLEKNDSFLIRYLSINIVDRLKFKHYDLKNKDFHSTIFPIPEMGREHAAYMKKFLFFSRNSYQKTNTFFKSADNFLINLSIQTKVLPIINHDFVFIINVHFNDNKDLFEKTNLYNKYSFLLNQYFEFIGLSPNFYYDFGLNLKILREFRVNFIQLFCLDRVKIFKKLNEQKRYNENDSPNKSYIKQKSTINLLKINPTRRNIYEENNAFTIFKNINYENVFKLRNIRLYEDAVYSSIKIHDKIDKKKVFKTIPELKHLIDEYGLDSSLHKCLEEFGKRLKRRDKEDTEIRERETVTTESFMRFLRNMRENERMEEEKQKRIIRTSEIISNKIKNKVLKEQSNNNKSHENHDDESESLIVKNKNSLVIPGNELDLNESVKDSSIISYSSDVGKTLINSYKEKKKNNPEYDATEGEFIDANMDLFLSLSKLGKKSFILAEIFEKTVYGKFLETESNIEDVINSEGNSLIKPSSKNTPNPISPVVERVQSRKKSNESNGIGSQEILKKTSQILQNKYLESKLETIEDEDSDRENEGGDVKRPKKNGNLTNSPNSHKHKMENKEKISLISYKKAKKFDENSKKSSKEYQRKEKDIDGKPDRRVSKQVEIGKNENLNKNLIENGANIIKEESIKEEQKNSVVQYTPQEIQKEESNDRIPFVSQEELDSHMKSSKNKLKYISLMVTILGLASLVVILLRFFFASNGTSFQKGLVKECIYMEVLRLDLYIFGIISSILCMDKNKTNYKAFSDNDILGEQFRRKSEDIMEHLKILQEHIKVIHDNVYMSKILSYFYGELTLKRLGDDWVIYPYKTYLFSEMRYIFFNMYREYYLRYNTNCRVTDLFILGLKRTKDIFDTLHDSTFQDKIFYYTIVNTLKVYKVLFDQIAEENVKVQAIIIKNFMEDFFILNMILIVIIILLEFFYLYRLSIDKKTYLKLMLYFFHFEKYQLQLETEVYFLINVTEEFDLDDLIIFEEIKKENNSFKHYHSEIENNFFNLDKLKRGEKNLEKFQMNKIVEGNNLKGLPSGLINVIPKEIINTVTMKSHYGMIGEAATFNPNFIYKRRDAKRSAPDINSKDLLNSRFSQVSLKNSAQISNLDIPHIQFSEKNANIIGNANKSKEKQGKNGSFIVGMDNNSSSLALLVDNGGAKNGLEELNEKVKGNNVSSGKKFKTNLNKKGRKGQKKEEKPKPEKERLSISEDSDILNEREESYEYIGKTRKLLPIMALINILINLILAIFILALTFINFYHSSSNKNKWIYAVNLSMNYLEQIPSLLELGVLYIISVIVGTTKIMPNLDIETYINNTKSYLTFFGNSSSFMSKEYFEKHLYNNYYASLLMDNYFIKNNIKTFKSSENSYLFPETKKWDDKLNEKDYFCLNAALGKISSYENSIHETTYDLFYEMNEIVKLCIDGGRDVNSNGLTLEINFIQQELTNLFIDFYNEINSKTVRTEEENRKIHDKYLYDKNFIRMVSDMEIPLMHAFNAISQAIKKDMEKINTHASKLQLNYTELLLFIDILFLLFIYMVINANKKYSKDLMFFVELEREKNN